MAKCVVRGCEYKVVGGFERHVYSTAPDVTPTIIDRLNTLWCAGHESSLKNKVRPPGRWLTQKDIDRP